MGFFDKAKGLFKGEPYNDDEFVDYGDEGFDEPEYDDTGYAQTAQAAPAPKANRGMGLNSGALEMKVVKPDKYDSATAQKIADHLLSNRTVVLNLESTNKESARRLIDFLSGVAYSIGGYIQRVAVNTFIIVPENVDISGEQLQEARKTEDNDIY